MALIPATLSKVVLHLDSTGQTLYISEAGGGRHFPIVIGSVETSALLRKIEDMPDPGRPLTHDLLGNAITALGGTPREVRIVGLHESTFVANIVIEVDDGEVLLDARPSDAMVLAAHLKLPLLVEESVLNRASTSHLFEDLSSAASAAAQGNSPDASMDDDTLDDMEDGDEEEANDEDDEDSADEFDDDEDDDDEEDEDED